MVWVPLFLTTVVTIVIFQGVFLRMVLGLFLVEEIKALRLKELIDFSTRNTSNGLLCESVRNWFAFLPLAVLKKFCLPYS